jgi:hypothetical protein
MISNRARVSGIQPDSMNRMVYRSRLRLALCALGALLISVHVLTEVVKWGAPQIGNLGLSYAISTQLRYSSLQAIVAPADSLRASSGPNHVPKWLLAIGSYPGATLVSDSLYVSRSCPQPDSNGLRLRPGRSPPAASDLVL